MKVNGFGCSLMDYLYNRVSFSAPAFERYRSRQAGDGGLVTGGLVFASGLARFAGKPSDKVLEEIAGGRSPSSRNLGGPAVVALVHAAQMLHDRGDVAFYGVRGNDDVGSELIDILRETPLDYAGYDERPGATPRTYVLSDPTYDGGRGERTFVNDLGVAADYPVDMVPDSFFDADITVFGGTALLPEFHDQLHVPVQRAYENGSLTVVNTVYDFFNEARGADRTWPLGDTETTLAHTHVLILDGEEARRISGFDDPERAAAWFLAGGVSAVLITRGPEPVVAGAGGGRFTATELESFPISSQVSGELANNPTAGDTTGCGDNFVGGVVAALGEQLQAGNRVLDLREAVSVGVVSGGFACFHLGGTYLEKEPGEKRAQVMRYLKTYREQLDSQ